MCEGKEKKITSRQLRFVEAYLATLSVGKAAKEVGLQYATGLRYLEAPAVREELHRRRDELRARADVRVDDVVRELAAIAFSDVRKAVSWCEDGTTVIVPSSELSDDTAHAIKSIRADGTGGVRVHMHDKMKALELLGKYLGMYMDKVEQKIEETQRLVLFDGGERLPPREEEELAAAESGGGDAGD